MEKGAALDFDIAIVECVPCSMNMTAPYAWRLHNIYKVVLSMLVADGHTVKDVTLQ